MRGLGDTNETETGLRAVCRAMAPSSSTIDAVPLPRSPPAMGWISLLFELAVDPTIPEHNQLFPIPQFVYARLDPTKPLSAAGVWGTGRGPISDLEITGRFSLPGCLPFERQR